MHGATGAADLPTVELRRRAVAAGWLHPGERPAMSRLRFPLDERHLTRRRFDRSRRDRVLAEMLDGTAAPEPLGDLFGATSDADRLIAESDRYGFPLRTVLNLQSGLMRTDPYYGESYLARFYRSQYRPLYDPNGGTSESLTRIVGRGQRIRRFVGSRLPAVARVLDVGCGAGGTLVAFAAEGHTCIGCDFDETYLACGRRLHLDLRAGGLEQLAGEAPFDLVIASHVIEHCRDPFALLEQVRPWVAESGLLYVEVPGVLSIDAHHDGNLLEFLQNAHCWHFTEATLRAVLQRAGFEIVRITPEIRVLARPGPYRHAVPTSDGRSVWRELCRLERRYAWRQRVRTVRRWLRSVVRRCRQDGRRTDAAE